MDRQVNVSDEVISALSKLGNATVFYLLMLRGVGRKYGAGPCWMKNVHPLAPGRRLAGRAVTLRYLPMREDLQARIATSRAAGGMNETPRWRALEACGPGDILVSDALGQSLTSTGGEIVYRRLFQRGATGVVTDGGIRDAGRVVDFGWPVYAGGRTPSVGETSIMPYEVNVPIQCGGVLVWPGDVILGDDDGVVVVAASFAEEIARDGTRHEGIEQSILESMEETKTSPARYYPFNDDTLALHKARIEREEKQKKRPAGVE